MRAARQHLEHLGSAGFGCLRVSGDSFRFNWHYHPEYELTLITKGAGMRFVGDSVDSYVPGDFVLLGPNVPHAWASHANAPAGAETLATHFGPDFLADELLARADAVAVRELLRSPHGALRFRNSTSVARELGELETASGLRRLLLLLEILLELGQAKGEPLCSAGFARPPEQARRRIDEVCRFLHENCTRPVSLSEAAEIAHMTPDSFSRFFRQAMGRSFTSYLNELKVARACALLFDTDLPITDVAAESGFANLANFNRRFKELKEMTPRSYRRHFSETADSPARAPRRS